MLIARAASVLIVAACASAPLPVGPDASTAEVEQAARNTCDPPNYPCNPKDPFANTTCEWICGDGTAGVGYCMPYNARDEIYCMNHPDTFITLAKYCDAWGNPIWRTRCVAWWSP